MKTRWLGLIVGAFALAFGSAALAGPDEDAIAHMMKAAFDKPESRLTVSPTVVPVIRFAQQRHYSTPVFPATVQTGSPHPLHSPRKMSLLTGWLCSPNSMAS